MTSFRSTQLVFTVTPGRSGTRLLCALSNCIDGVMAEHEGPPRMNFVMRALYNHPAAMRAWLETEMFPSIFDRCRSRIHVETSHLFCKGFIEPTLALGLRPKFFLLTRSPRQVAESLFAINCIPERTEDGRLVLLGPSDLGVRGVEGYGELSDYQMCYWYAKEIERRQAFYETWLPTQGCEVKWIDFSDLRVVDRIFEVAQFITGTSDPRLDFEKVKAVLNINQNPRSSLAGVLRELPAARDREQQQTLIDDAFS